MSELDTLAHELRTMANKLRRVLLNDGVCYMETLDTLYLSMGDMREAADTIESLRDRLQERETCELEPLPAIVVTMNMLNEIGWCKCSKCGYATPDESNYCQNCGASVKAVGE